MLKPFKNVIYSGVVTIVIGVMLLVTFPQKLPWMIEGFSHPVLAFQYTGSVEEVHKTFGIIPTGEKILSSGEVQDILDAMIRGDIVDLFYPLGYVAVMIFLSFKCFQLSGNKIYLFALTFAALAGISDWAENTVELIMLHALPNGDIEPLIPWHMLFVRTKFFFASVSILITGKWFLDDKEFKNARYIGYASIAIAIFGLFASIYRSSLTQIYGYSMIFPILGIIFYAYKKEMRIIDNTDK